MIHMIHKRLITLSLLDNRVVKIIGTLENCRSENERAHKVIHTIIKNGDGKR
jgi:hypothetical protein